MRFEAKNLWDHYHSLELVALAKSRMADPHSWEQAKQKDRANQWNLAKTLLIGVFGTTEEVNTGRPMNNRKNLDLKSQ